MFTQCDDYKGRFGDLSQYMIEGVRHYGVDDQTVYPSVTSVISFISRKKFADWRAKVGNEVANAKWYSCSPCVGRVHDEWRLQSSRGVSNSSHSNDVQCI